MKYLLILLLLPGCASLSDEQRSERAIALAEHEPDRIEKWGIYEDDCDHVGIMLWGPHSRKCRPNKECIPGRLDWDFFYKCRKGDAEKQNACENKLVGQRKRNWRAHPGNNVQCTSRRLF